MTQAVSMAPDSGFSGLRFESDQGFVQARQAPGAPRPARLAVRVVIGGDEGPCLAGLRIGEAMAAAGGRLQAAFERHVGGLADAAEVLAARLRFAEVNKVPAPLQAQMVRDGRDASIVADAAVGQRRLAPDVQAALVAHCRQHVFSMQQLAARGDATLQVLLALAGSEDARTRLNVAAGIAARLRIEEPHLADKKAAVLRALIADYDSSYAPYLVPVCKDVDQLRAMYEKASGDPGEAEAFVDNPYTPDSVLLGIASSAGRQAGLHGVAGRAREVLQLRVDQRDSSTYNDVAPS